MLEIFFYVVQNHILHFVGMFYLVSFVLFPCVLRQILMYPRLVLSLVYSKDGFELLIPLSPTADVGITGVYL